MRSKQPLVADMPEMAVNLDSPSVQQMRRRERRRVRLGWAIIVGAVFTIIAFTVLAIGYFSNTNADGGGAGATSTPGRAQAWATMERWLASEPQPLPGGQVLSWDGADITEVAATQQGADAYSIETHTFTLSAGNALFSSTVPVYVDSITIAALAQPSLMPLVAGGDVPTGVTAWPGYESGPNTAAIEAAADTWAEAFTSGDAAQLKFAVNDSDVDAYYVPLTGIESIESTVTETGVREGADSSQLIARVELEVVWAGQNPDVTGAQVITYDVLIDGVGTGSPRVVSWGGAGTGPTLEPYSVALDLGDSTVDSSEVPTAPSSSPPPSTDEGEPDTEQPAPTEQQPAPAEDTPPADTEPTEGQEQP